MSTDAIHNAYSLQFKPEGTHRLDPSEKPAQQQAPFAALIAEPAQDQPLTREEKIAKTNEDVMATREAPRDPVQEFMDFMDKTPAERMREMILKEMGLTEEQLERLPPEERRQIEEKIAAMIEERMREKTQEKLEQAELRGQIQAAQAQGAIAATTPIPDSAEHGKLADLVAQIRANQPDEVDQ